VDPEKAAIRSDYGEERYETLELQKGVRNIFFNLMDDSWTVILSFYFMSKVINAERDIIQVHQDMKRILESSLPGIIHSPLRETLWME
jgi:thymidylate kinase